MQENEDFVPEDETLNPASEGAGPEGSAPNAQDEDSELTVEDILNEAQSEAAKQAESTAAETENPYLEDLRRLSAEYANYRKRTENNRQLEAERAVAKVVEPLLGVLDDLDRAQAHGDLKEGSAFHTIAQKIRTTLEKMGLESFGEAGEVFDPEKHEAIAQVPVPGTEENSVLDVVERGYRIGAVELRPAKVAVAVNPDG